MSIARIPTFFAMLMRERDDLDLNVGLATEMVKISSSLLPYL